MEYAHTQRAPLYLVLLAVAGVLAASAWAARGTPVVSVLAAAAVLVGVAAVSFRTLSVTDQGQWLDVRFGPVPLFGTRIEYAEITAVEASRSRFVDGWGVHYLPGRGWSYNLWGFDCVVVQRGDRCVRIGTDDAEKLAAFLRRKANI